jgi:hypothetical protein
VEQPEDFAKMSLPELVAFVRQLEATYAIRAEDSPPQDAPEQPEDNGRDA